MVKNQSFESVIQIGLKLQHEKNYSFFQKNQLKDRGVRFISFDRPSSLST